MTDHICITTTNTDQNSTLTVYSLRHCKPWSTSHRGLSFTAVWESGVINGVYQGRQVTEGFILTAYRDNVGIPTVGCGHRILPKDNINVGDTITLERAMEFRKLNVADVEIRLNKDIRVPLHQYEYDALVSIAFNCGSGRGSDEIIEKINTGNYDAMSDYVLSYRAGENRGMKHRRFAEARLFKSGVYDASH